MSYDCAVGRHGRCDNWINDTGECCCHCHLSETAVEHDATCDILGCVAR